MFCVVINILTFLKWPIWRFQRGSKILLYAIGVVFIIVFLSLRWPRWACVIFGCREATKLEKVGITLIIWASAFGIFWIKTRQCRVISPERVPLVAYLFLISLDVIGFWLRSSCIRYNLLCKHFHDSLLFLSSFLLLNFILLHFPELADKFLRISIKIMLHLLKISVLSILNIF